MDLLSYCNHRCHASIEMAQLNFTDEEFALILQQALDLYHAIGPIRFLYSRD